jgi:hypothetical protein
MTPLDTAVIRKTVLEENNGGKLKAVVLTDVDNIRLVDVGENVFELPRLSTNLDEAAHHRLGELLHELQRRYDAGELKCLAVAWTDERGASYTGAAGLLIADSLPLRLKELAALVFAVADASDIDQATLMMLREKLYDRK